MSQRDEYLIVGVGEEFHGDDSLGSLTVEALRSARPEGVRLVCEPGEAPSLAGLLREHPRALIVDTFRTGMVPGTIYFVSGPLRTRGHGALHSSSHATAILQAIGLATGEGTRSEQAMLCGIEGFRFSVGEPVSQEVRAAIPILVNRILASIERFRTLSENSRCAIIPAEE